MPIGAGYTAPGSICSSKAGHACYTFIYYQDHWSENFMLRLIFVLLLVSTQTASARMYQWVDPESGSTQLSGKPPMWYRSSESGPRVFVFEKSKVIDDTGIEVSKAERDRLRQRAFLQADEDKELAREKILRSKRIDAVLKQQQAGRQAELEKDKPLPPLILEEEVEEEAPSQPRQAETLEEMRKLIEDWEKAQTDKAKNVLKNPQGS